MHDAFKISLTAAVMGTVVGAGLQSAADPVLQTVGQGWMLGGVASTAILGGFAAASSAWKSYKEERNMNQRIEALETVHKSGAPVSFETMNEFIETARSAGRFFESARDSKKEAVFARVAALGAGLFPKSPAPEAARDAVAATLTAVSFRLATPLPSMETKAPAEPAFSSSSPSLS